jgi:hypothetical protein
MIGTPQKNLLLKKDQSLDSNSLQDDLKLGVLVKKTQFK